ncbi:hypothetical protein EXU57_14150 [Segetibacter sp. 3557_3]|uniref:hypothetical protein n=1 Tax=Segetibacter sp. 3557_3 TaxID=2547429 RepID=UPI0010586223|nr:hypothetical protein [Segetibacter sp. 3557_3]TDH25242.1 hypothetical protein EXU57_14150 [Segetibacter sp. 3557_3]
MEYLVYNWYFFNFVFGVFQVLGFIMIGQSRRFYTKELVVRKFSIMELKLPATPASLYNVIAGLFQLDARQRRISIEAVRRQLFTDFLFMPLTYAIVFMLCWRVADKISLEPARQFYTFLGLLQPLCLLVDMSANVFLLRKLKPNTQLPSKANHRIYLRLQLLKWIIFVVASVCSIAAICYFWLVGNYSGAAFNSLLMVLGQLLVFCIAVLLLPQQPPAAEVTSNRH